MKKMTLLIIVLVFMAACRRDIKTKKCDTKTRDVKRLNTTVIDVNIQEDEVCCNDSSTLDGYDSKNDLSTFGDSDVDTTEPSPTLEIKYNKPKKEPRVFYKDERVRIQVICSSDYAQSRVVNPHFGKSVFSSWPENEIGFYSLELPRNDFQYCHLEIFSYKLGWESVQPLNKGKGRVVTFGQVLFRFHARKFKKAEPVPVKESTQSDIWLLEK